jgi:polysaccharide export outer membrane protein
MGHLRKSLFFVLLLSFVLGDLGCAPKSTVLRYAGKDQAEIVGDYKLGVNDVLEIKILQPEEMESIVTVAPDGSIGVPYIGSVQADGHTLTEIQQEIQQRLADGYMKYPVVAVSLQESRSQRFFVYGEVDQPGAYELEQNMTVLGGISMAGGFSRFGSASRVKVLRPKKDAPGYDIIKVNVKAVMAGSPKEDIVVEPGDIVVVSEGLF